jgi:hypothetical protein
MLSPVERDGFRIQPRMEATEIFVTITGSCDSQTTPLLGQFVVALHDETLRVGARTVVLDCNSLYFMNSAAIKCFVTWTAKIKTLPEVERYSVRVRTNRFLAWQQRSFGAVRRSAPEVLTVD